MNGYQSHLLTPSIGVELSPQKQQAIETQKARLDRTYTGGGGQSAAAGVPSSKRASTSPSSGEKYGGASVVFVTAPSKTSPP